jgi:hypothetical protein
MKAYKDLTTEERELWEDGYLAGHDVGYEKGYSNAHDIVVDDEDLGQDTYNDGFEAGIEKERDRVQYILNMMFESSLNMGKGQKAVFYREVMELLKPVEVKEYYPEDEDF